MKIFGLRYHELAQQEGKATEEAIKATLDTIKNDIEMLPTLDLTSQTRLVIKMQQTLNELNKETTEIFNNLSKAIENLKPTIHKKELKELLVYRERLFFLFKDDYESLRQELRNLRASLESGMLPPEQPTRPSTP